MDHALQSPPAQLPVAVRTDGSNAFAHHSMAVRVPGIIQDILDRNADYSSMIRDDFKRLHDQVASNASLRLFKAPAPDFDMWTSRFATSEHESWLDTEWFFAEMLVYRLMVEAGQFWMTLRDPFTPFKQEELASDGLWHTLAAALSLEGSRDEQLAAYLTYSLWGNRIDLSLKQTAAMGTSAGDEHLLANDIPLVVHHLLDSPTGAVHIVMDNAGTEQALDMALVDFLLTSTLAETVTLHVKMQPVLVSDAIVADIHILFDLMKARGDKFALVAERLLAYLENGRLSIVPDFFWNTAGRLWELPPRIYHPFRNAQLVITKGDVNYRRATNDALWPAEATLSDAVPNFPAPLLALRTLKCDTLVGINQSRQDYLDAHGEPNWRNSGAYGVAQFAR